MIYLLRQMKSLSAYSSEKGFNVSSLGANAICIKSDFVQTFLFSPSPPVAHVDGFKGGTLPPHVFCVFRYWTTGSGNHYHRAEREQHITQYFYPQPFLEKTNCK